MRGEEKRNLRECKGGEASTFAASPQPYLGEARGHPIRTVPGGAPCGLLIPRSTRGAHRRARPSRPQPLIRPGPGQAARGVRTMSPARPELPPDPPARRGGLTRWPSCSWGSPGAPGSRGSEAACAQRCARGRPRAPWVSAGATRGKPPPPLRRPRSPPRRRSAPGSRRAAEPRRGAAAPRPGGRRGARPCSGPWRAAGRPGADARGRRRGAEGRRLARAHWHGLGRRDPPAAAAAAPPRPRRGRSGVPAAAGARLGSGSQTVVSVRLFVPSPAESSSSSGSACTEVCGFPQGCEVWPCLPMGV